MKMVIYGSSVVCSLPCHPLSPLVTSGGYLPPLTPFTPSSLSPLSPLSPVSPLSSPPPILPPIVNSTSSIGKPLIQSSVLFFNSSGLPNGLYFIPMGKRQLYGMEQIWNEQFNKLFHIFPHTWRLIQVEQRPFGGNILYNYNDSAKVRFCCDGCGNGWTSMKGRVAFFFDVTFPGIVAYTLFGQKCQKCESHCYEEAMWYPEEVTKVLYNMRNEIGHLFYGWCFKPKEKTRRIGKPRTPHNSNLCQACKDGICADK